MAGEWKVVMFGKETVPAGVKVNLPKVGGRWLGFSGPRDPFPGLARPQ